MKMLKLNVLFVATVLLTSLFFTACESQDDLVLDPMFESTEKSGNGGMTLLDFAQAQTDPESINFFNTTPVTDNSGLTDGLLSISARDLMCTQRWTKGGCIQLGGMCFVLFPYPGEEWNTSAYIAPGKILLDIHDPENGIFSDGLYPIGDDLYLDETTTIAAGIYQATINPATGTFTRVVVDTY